MQHSAHTHPGDVPRISSLSGTLQGDTVQTLLLIKERSLHVSPLGHVIGHVISFLGTLEFDADVHVRPSSVAHVHGIEIGEQADGVQHCAVVLVNTRDVSGGSRAAAAR